ncbi:MAG: tyrosine recombinase XerC [Spirochaetales bacterium]|nr:MAG: tyrosine recombinase XerC [Spirochaetales bacterium]
MIDTYLQYLQSVRNLSPETVRAYGNDIHKFMIYCERENFEPGSADQKTVRGFVADLYFEGLKKTSINRILSAMRNFYGYQVKHGGLKGNPFSSFHSLKKDGSLPGFLFEEEMNELVHLPGGGFAGVRDRLILELLYSSGCRVSELTGMNLQHLVLGDRSILVRGKGSKERFVYIGTAAFEAMRDYLPLRRHHIKAGDADAEMALFLNLKGTRLTARGVAFLISKYLKKMSMNKHVSPHTFRHTFATHLLNRGADIRVVQELLGHASLSTTQVYTHLGLSRLKKIYEKAHPHARMKKNNSVQNGRAI